MQVLPPPQQVKRDGFEEMQDWSLHVTLWGVRVWSVWLVWCGVWCGVVCVV